MCQLTKKKICLVACGLQGGGQERIVSGLANHYCRLGHRVSLLLLFQGEHFYRTDDRIRIYEPALDRSRMNKYRYMLALISYIRKTLKEIDPDTVLSIGEWINSYVILATRGLGYPVYVSDRLSPDRRLSGLHDLGHKYLYARCSGIIAQTEYAARVIGKKTRSKRIRVIPNPVNKIDRCDCEPRKRIVTLGRLSPEKGHAYLLRAFARLAVGSDWELSIIGNGAERANLERLAAELGIEHRVIFHGHQLDFEPLLSEAQIFVLPSLSEGFPNALIEAMTVPLPCISFDCVAGPADIIRHGENGLLVEPRNVDKLAEAMADLIDHPDKRIRLAAEAAKIADRLAFDKIAGEYLEFILSDE